MNNTTKLMLIIAFLSGYMVNDVVSGSVMTPAFAEYDHRDPGFRKAVLRAVDGNCYVDVEELGDSAYVYC